MSSRRGTTGGSDSQRVNYLNNHFSRKITVEDAVRIAGISRSAFFLRFPAENGMTVSRHLNRRRLAAVEWLVASGIPREEVAQRCGENPIADGKNWKQGVGRNHPLPARRRITGTAIDDKFTVFLNGKPTAAFESVLRRVIRQMPQFSP